MQCVSLKEDAVSREILPTDIQTFMEVATAVEMNKRGVLSKTFERLKTAQVGLHASKICVNPFILLTMSSITYKGSLNGSRFS